MNESGSTGQRASQIDNPDANAITRRALLGTGVVALAAFIAACSRKGTDPPNPAPSSSAVITFATGAAASTSTSAAATAGTSPDAPIIFIDPGHGGVDEGAIGTAEDGQPVLEKTIALAIARKTLTQLETAGYQVVLSRTSDTLPGVTAADLTPDGLALTPDGVLNDLQRRINRANASGAQLFLSIHLNASDDPEGRGVETYYDSERPFGADNERWAQLVQSDVIAAMHSKGYDTPDRGLIDDTTLEMSSLGTLPDDYNHLVLLGPAVQGRLQPTLMPGALNEALFLTNPAEASAATDPDVQDLIASGYAQAVIHYFAPRS